MLNRNVQPRRCYYIVIAVVAIAMILISLNACATPKMPIQPPEPDAKGLVIRYLTAPKQVLPSKGAEVLCVATDANGNAITYEWSSTAGEIQARKEPESILWVAPSKEGNYIITVAVTNADGGKVTKSVNITVSKDPDQRPIIYGVKCQDCREGTEASKFSQYTLRCDASVPSGGTLHYTWFANLGKIKGEGASATWFTGAQYGNALITVIVADDKGNETEGYLAINVSCCN
jgi:hypothetical protein